MLYLSACRTCSTIIFPYSTNQIKPMICGVVVAVAVVISLTLSYQLVWHQILVNNEPGRSRCLCVRHKWPEKAELEVHPMELCWVEDLYGPEDTVNKRQRAWENGVNPGEHIPGNENDHLDDWSPEKDSCWRLRFRQPVRKPSSESRAYGSFDVTVESHNPIATSTPKFKVL